MKYAHQVICKKSQAEVAGLFRSVFSASEGAEEGALIGDLASSLASRIDDQDIICLGTYEGESIVGCLFFTRLRFSSPIAVYMLSPMAVLTERQGEGVGKALINYGLSVLRNRSVSAAVTYGDPAFYSKVGFHSLSEDIIQAPLKLSLPEGWLAQSLTGEPIPAIDDRPVCVREFNNSAYW